MKRGKTDAADAEAICEAVSRPTMRFVPIKSKEQQALLSMHRARDLFVKQRTQLINMMRGMLAEFGITIPEGIGRALIKARQIVEGEALDTPAEASQMAAVLGEQALNIHLRLREIDRALAACQRENAAALRVATVPGVGPITATAIVASVPTPELFASGRQFAA
ncbi:hypothetical protein CDQ91_17225 [Sphingopyxis witflariensis]|uniref:Uncharacterized protein n=1 Tax=Sphingopyxis witflariensis TaxID=173675 RepID=A0A246JJW7_9SPHN|nr:hypothetical protein CDQ91_17225 [Sphingopyxis witflariensis]